MKRTQPYIFGPNDMATTKTWLCVAMRAWTSHGCHLHSAFFTFASLAITSAWHASTTAQATIMGHITAPTTALAVHRATFESELRDGRWEVCEGKDTVYSTVAGSAQHSNLCRSHDAPRPSRPPQALLSDLASAQSMTFHPYQCNPLRSTSSAYKNTRGDLRLAPSTIITLTLYKSFASITTGTYLSVSLPYHLSQGPPFWIQLDPSLRNFYPCLPRYPKTATLPMFIPTGRQAMWR